MTTPKTPEGWHPTNVFQAFMTAAQEIIDHNHRELVSDWLTRAWHHKVLPALAPTAPAGGEAPAEASDAQREFAALSEPARLALVGASTKIMNGVHARAYIEHNPDHWLCFEFNTWDEVDAALRAVKAWDSAGYRAKDDAPTVTPLYTHPSADLRGAAEQALEALEEIASFTSTPRRQLAIATAAIASLEAAISRKGKTE